MTTFHQFLTAQSNRQDEVGELARLWISAEGDRPKASTPSGISRYIESLGNPEHRPWLEAATKEYRESRGLKSVTDSDRAEGSVMAVLQRIEGQLALIMAHLGIVQSEEITDAALRQLASPQEALRATADAAMDAAGDPREGVMRHQDFGKLYRLADFEEGETA